MLELVTVSVLKIVSGCISRAAELLPHDVGAFAFIGCPQFSDTESGRFDVNVDPVEQRAADAATVALYLSRGTGTFPLKGA